MILVRARPFNYMEEFSGITSYNPVINYHAILLATLRHVA